MVMLEPSLHGWALLVSVAVFKKLRIIRMPKASREIAFEQCSPKRAACQCSRHRRGLA